MIFCFVFEFIMLLLKPVLVIAVIMTAIIVAGAFIAAIFSVFPVVGIILATIVISAVIYKVAVFVKDKKEEKHFREAEENRRKKLNKELEKHLGL